MSTFRSDIFVTTTQGQAVPNASIYYLTNQSGATPQTVNLAVPVLVYTDSTGITTTANPVITDAFGHANTGAPNVAPYLQAGSYTIAVVLSNGSIYQVLNDQLIGTSGGGSVLTVFGRTGNVISVANDYAFSQISGTITVAQLTGTVFGASGTSHSIGVVPDPGALLGNTRFLREDATWQVPAGFIPSLVQKRPFVLNSSTGAQTLSNTYSLNNTTGNLLVAISHSLVTQTVDSVTDTQGNTWVPANLNNSGVSLNNIQLWYAVNCKGGPNTVTASSSSAGGFWYLSVAEYSGVAISGSIMECFNIIDSSGTTASVTSNIPSPSDLVIVDFASQTGSGPAGTFSAFTGGISAQETFTFNEFSGVWADNSGSPIPSGVATFGATVSLNVGWSAQMWCFRPANYLPATNLAFVRQSFYQVKQGVGTSSSSPAVIQFAGGNDAGNSIFVTTTQYINVVADGVTGITDTNGNAYELVAKASTPAGILGAYVAVYAARNCVGSRTPNIVTVAFDNSIVNDVCEVFAVEFAGNFTLDTTAVLSSGSGTGGSGTITASKTGELLLSVFSLGSEQSQSFISAIAPPFIVTQYLPASAPGAVGCEQLVAFGYTIVGSNVISVTSSEPGYVFGAGALTLALIPTIDPVVPVNNVITSRTSNVTTTTLLTTGASNASYNIQADAVFLTTTASETVVIVISYTDTSGTVQTVTSSAATATTLGSASVTSLNLTVRAQAGTNITYAFTTGVASGAHYEGSVSVQQITAA